MSRHLFVAVAALLLAACGDDPSPGECDPTQFDCTPITPPSTCIDDTTDENCEPTTNEPPVYVPTKDEMREAGVVFLGDEDFNGLSQTFVPETPAGDEFQDFVNLLAVGNANYADCVYLEDPRPMFWLNCAWRGPGENPESPRAVEFFSDWMQHDQWMGYRKAAMKSGSFCLPEWEWDRRDSTNIHYLHAQSRLYEYDAGKLTIHSPPVVDESWMCIETPYGAGWLHLEGSRSIEGDRSVKWREPRAERTCHPDLDWISFVSSSNNRDIPAAIAYTVGTRYADFLPVSECAPWGTAKVYPPYAR